MMNQICSTPLARAVSRENGGYENSVIHTDSAPGGATSIAGVQRITSATPASQGSDSTNKFIDHVVTKLNRPLEGCLEIVVAKGMRKTQCAEPNNRPNHWFRNDSTECLIRGFASRPIARICAFRNQPW